MPGTAVVWLLRGNDPAKSFGGGANDKLVARGELGAHFASLVASGQVRVEAGFSGFCDRTQSTANCALRPDRDAAGVMSWLTN